jgi:hypothetical protein
MLDSSLTLRLDHRGFTTAGAAFGSGPLQVDALGVSNIGVGARFANRSTSEKPGRQRDHHDYTVMRMSDMPEIHVNVLSTENKPTGVGQMSTPVVAPAISNAVAGLLGVRLNHTPMLPQRVLAAIRNE